MFTVNESTTTKKLTEEKYLCRPTTNPVRNASDALQNYIDQFTSFVQTNPRTPKNGCYASSNVSHSSSRQLKSVSSRRKATKSTQKSGKMAGDLVQWVNESYLNDLQRKIVPFGQKSNSSVDMSETDGNDDDTSTISASDVQISTLPSPGSSVVIDLDSDIGSVNTEMLVKSYSGRGVNSQQHEGNGNHPSWVEELTAPKHYPSWIDEIDESQIGHQDLHNDSNNQRNHLSRSLSPSFFHQRSRSSPSPPSILSTSLQEVPTDEISVNPSHPNKQHKKSGAWDLESTDTEVLISESIYGRQPVNMGGKFHSSLYRDRKIEQLHDHSIRKFELEQSFPREMSFAQSRVEDKIKENLSTNKQQSLRKPKKSHDTKTPLAKHIDNTGRKHANISEPRLQRNKANLPRKEDYTSTNRPNSLKLPKREGGLSISEIRKHSTDSSNKDQLMRQSPTGIQMLKQNSGARSRHIDYNGKGGRNSKQTPTPTITRTPNIPHSTKSVLSSNTEVAPRRNASQELQRIIDLADVNAKQTTNRHRKEHYLHGKVSKTDLTKKERYYRHETLNKDKRIASRDNYPRLHGINTKNGHVHNNYPSRMNTWNLHSRRVDPRYEYPAETHPTVGDYSSNSDRRSSPRTQTLWYSDPTRFKPGHTTRDHKLRSRLRTKSAPSIAWESLPSPRNFRVTQPAQNRVGRTGARHTNEKPISSANYANERVIPEREDYETESVDTEALVIIPPMPLFDASPSLTTESAESFVESEESGDTLIENLALRTSLITATDSELQSSSGTSYLELITKHHHQQEDVIPERSEGWKDETSTTNNSRPHFNKPGIITSFLDDCMHSSEESRSNVKSNNQEFQASTVIEEEQSIISDVNSERPVETLKKMLFTVQRLAHSSEENSDRHLNDEGVETQSERLTEEILSDVISTASRNEGEDSLSRAYYHLARLKRLVSASKEAATSKRHHLSV